MVKELIVRLSILLLFCKVIKETNYKTLDGQYVTPIKHETIKD